LARCGFTTARLEHQLGVALGGHDPQPGSGARLEPLRHGRARPRHPISRTVEGGERAIGRPVRDDVRQQLGQLLVDVVVGERQHRLEPRPGAEIGQLAGEGRLEVARHVACE
jgi:hypothetical protein